MDVSQIKGSIDTTFSWNAHYDDTETDKFSVLLKDQDKDPEPIRETRSERKEDDYEPSDYADKDADYDDDSIEDRSAATSETDQRSDDPSPSVAALPIDPSLNKAAVVVSDPNVAGTTQGPAAGSPAREATAKTPAEGLAALGDKAQNTAPTLPGQANSAATGEQANNPANAPATGKVNGTGAQAETETKQTAPIGDAVKSAIQTAIAGQTSSQDQVATAKTNAETAKANAGSAQKSAPVVANTTKPVETTQVAASSGEALLAQENANGKTVKPETSNALETLRTEEIAKLSEKEVLSNKISDLLRSAKGKISLTPVSGSTTSSSSASLVTDQNAAASNIAFSSSQPNTATAIGTVTDAALQAEAPITLQPSAGTPAPVVQQAATDPSMTGNSSLQGAAIPGVEASSSNAASQAATAARVSTQAGGPAEQVATQISTAVRNGVDQIKIQLNPAELGQVDIKLEIAQDGRVMAVIKADSQDSLDLLQQDSKMLEQALKDAGFETDSDSLNFSLNQQGDQENEFGTANGRDMMEADDVTDEFIEPHQLQAYNRSSNSNLDIQV